VFEKIAFKWQVGFFSFFHVLERTLLVDLKLDNCCKLLRRKQARKNYNYFREKY